MKKQIIRNVFFDNNLLNRIIKKGIDKSLSGLASEVEKFGFEKFDNKNTQIITTPANIFEYAGIHASSFITAEDLEEICKLDDSNGAVAYLRAIYTAIEKRVSTSPQVQKDELMRRLLDKLPHIPKDSQKYVHSMFIQRLKEHPLIMRDIHDDISFHLYSGAKVKPSQRIQHHVAAGGASLTYFKRGQVGPIGKALLSMFEIMEQEDQTKELIPVEVRKKLKGLIAMHDVGDFLDSDLIHLACLGLKKGIVEPICCFTQDPPDKIAMRALLYRTMMPQMLAGHIKKSPSPEDFEGIEFAPAHIFVCDPDKNKPLTITDHFSIDEMKEDLD